MNSKAFRRKRPWLNKVLSQHSPARIRKPIQTSVKTVGVLAKIQTQRSLNICLERCHYVPFCDAVSTADVMTLELPDFLQDPHSDSRHKGRRS